MDTNQDSNAAFDEETKAIQSAKIAAGITYKPLVITTTDPDDPDKDGPRVAFRRPNRAEWTRYRAESLTPDPQVKANAFQTIVIPSLIYPDLKTFSAMLEAQPGIMELCGSELVEYAGAAKAKKVERL
jgi:hypothetical protein